MVERQLRGRDVEDERVLRAMERVPRELFVPEQLRPRAYDDAALPIGYGQTIAGAAAVPELPATLYEQLEARGRLVLPVGTRRAQELQVVVRSPEGPAVLRSVPCRFVPLVGEEGFEAG